MALNIGESQAVYDLVRYLLSGTDAVPEDRARAAAETLIDRAHKTLGAGFTADQLVEWWPDNAVASIESWAAEVGNEGDTLEAALAMLPGYMQDAPLNAAGREALG
jgi:hypothetical protein